MANRVLILGASARAAAASARRAGLTAFAIDLFADRDTERLCERVWRCPPDRYPAGLFALARHAPPMPWMYTGGLENHPELIGDLATARELWGNGPGDLRTVRDPRWLSGQPFGSWATYPPVALPGDTPPAGGTWVRKPLRGSGGRGVRIANGSDVAGIADPNGEYFLQEFVTGSPASAVFRAGRLAGSSWQLIGETWLHAAPFAYAGSIAVGAGDYRGPVDLGDAHGLRGVWGADLMLNDGRLTLLEVNPRYPASAEAVEFATGQPLLAARPELPPRAAKAVGKAIYFAPIRVVFPPSGPWDDSLPRIADPWHRPDFADIPRPGEAIEPGHPVLTIMTEAPTVAECLRRLKSRAAELDRLFGHVPRDEELP